MLQDKTHGLYKLEQSFRDKIAPRIVSTLMKVYGQYVDVFKVRNKEIPNLPSSSAQGIVNKFSRDVYQNFSLSQEDANSYQYPPIDNNQEDYLNDLDKIGTKKVLITDIEFQQFNGIIAGSEREYNMYCLDHDFNVNDIVELKSIEGVEKRYKVSGVNFIGDTTNVLKRYIIISVVL